MSSLGTEVILLVLSCGDSNNFIKKRYTFSYVFELLCTLFHVILFVSNNHVQK